MAAAKSRKRKAPLLQVELDIRGPRIMQIPERLGGGLVKDYAEIDLLKENGDVHCSQTENHRRRFQGL